MALRQLDTLPDGPRFQSYDPHTRLYRITTGPAPDADTRDLTADQARAYVTGATALTSDQTGRHRTAATNALRALSTLTDLPYLDDADRDALTAVRRTLQHFADQTDAAHHGAQDAEDTGPPTGRRPTRSRKRKSP
jgi:hypothetical protein